MVSRRRPRLLARGLRNWFAESYGIEIAEADRDLDDYANLYELFTRRLKSGARAIGPGIVSPVDAAVGAAGRASDGRLIQAKGIDYGLEALLGSAEEARAFGNGHYVTLYLSPRDYHRIHMPVDGRIVRTLYEPGTLWPVNPPAVRTIPELFAVNERVSAIVETNQGRAAVAMVGATNVGSIRLSYTDVVTNRAGRVRRHIEHDPPVELSRGDELGLFAMGSTVILLTTPQMPLEPPAAGEWIPMGRSLSGDG